jgi:hypothetical protein
MQEWQKNEQHRVYELEAEKQQLVDVAYDKLNNPEPSFVYATLVKEPVSVLGKQKLFFGT